MLKKYKFGFDIWGLVIFLIVMIPTFIWSAVPAPNDILREESITPIIDVIGSVCQVLFAAILCVLINQERKKLKLSPLIIAAIISIIIYFAGWILYYCGNTSPLVIMALTLPPCFAFFFFALDRRNILAVFPIACFTVCHMVYGIVNFCL